MDNDIKRIFDEIDAKKEEVRASVDARVRAKRDQAEAAKHQVETNVTEKVVAPKMGPSLGIFELLFNGIRAAKDVMTPAPVKAPEVEAQEAKDYRGSTIMNGTDFTYTVPANIKQIRVQILESNGRLKNEYTLTNYMAINSGDKFRLIVD